MSRDTKRIGLAFLAVVMAFGFTLPSAWGQPFQMAPGLNPRDPYNSGVVAGIPSQNLIGSRPGIPAGGSMTSSYPGYGSMMSQPNTGGGASGYNPYGMYNLPDPYAGNLYGSAAVTDSLGRYMLSTQQAYLMQEQLKSEKIKTRRMMLEQWLWEREHLPTAQDEFERQQKEQFRRSRNDPPVSEILSAKALNDLLTDIQQLQSKDIRGPEVQVNQDILKKINVSPPGKGAANVGVLKNEGKLSWPLALRNNDFRQERDVLNTLATDAVSQAIAGRVDAATLNGMNETIEQFQQNLQARVKDIPTQQYIEAKRYLNDLKDGVSALSREDAAHYFSGTYSAKGRTVAELVQYMTEKGLRFTSSVPGEESAYVALHKLLAAYDISAAGGSGSAQR